MINSYLLAGKATVVILEKGDFAVICEQCHKQWKLVYRYKICGPP
jgi:hypothetical protein